MMRIYTAAILCLLFASLCAQTAEVIDCPAGDVACSKDKLGFEAIRVLHVQIDDDHDGTLNREESDEFIRDELKYEDGFERQVMFHGSDDHISVVDLWKLWVHSEVYNWTVEDAISWLDEEVGLPQYTDSFRVNAVEGHSLPRLATNGQYMTAILGIKNPVHKQKLAIKAQDLVLFGPPKRHNYVKDIALVASLVIAVGGCWLAYVQHKYSQFHLKKVMKDLGTLKESEDALNSLQKMYDEAKESKDSVMIEKRNLEKKMKDEIEHAKITLQHAEQELQNRSNAPLAELQTWLQLTYEIESKHYDAKKENAERQLMNAKDMYHKVGRSRGSVVAAIRMTHNGLVHKAEQSILKARAALEDVKQNLQERSHRWSQIEKTCGFSIITNPGLAYLENFLHSQGAYPFMKGGKSSPPLGGPMSVEDGEEDHPPSYYATTARPELKVWPNLMRAGMQLTMLGVGLTNQRAVPGTLMSGFPQEKRNTLTSAFGGSNTSLSGSLLSSSPGHSSLGHRSHTVSTFRPVQPVTPVQDLGSDESDTSDTGLQLSKPNGSVNFQLGEASEDRDTLKAMSREPRERTSSFNKAVSLDESTSKTKLPRSQTLPGALSESALAPEQNLQRRGVPSTSSAKDAPSRKSEDDHSSPESTDSFGQEDSKKKKKKSSKLKLFPKLLRKDSDKSKVS